MTEPAALDLAAIRHWLPDAGAWAHFINTAMADRVVDTVGALADELERCRAERDTAVAECQRLHDRLIRAGIEIENLRYALGEVTP